MKLTSKIDLEVPAGFVFDMLADHASWEREARRRGVEIERPVDTPATGPGASWRVKFRFRSKVRKVLIRIEDLRPDTHLTLSFEGQALEGGSELEVLALSARRSRLRVSVNVQPKTLAARLFLNTLRLAKRRVEARLDKQLAQLGARIVERFGQSRVTQSSAV